MVVAPSDASVSVLLPVLNEAEHIDDVLASLADQDVATEVEILVADGGSTDGTRERLAAWTRHLPRLRIIDNPDRLQAHGLNATATAATGDVLVRADGHTTYDRDYLSRSLERLLTSGAVAVGGNLTPVGRSPFGRAVATVMTSPLGVGPGRFHHARGDPVAADTVYLGAVRREDLLAMGGWRALPSGVAEDADLYHRFRQAGHTVLLDPAIRSWYRPRESVRAFWRQSLRYGRGKAELWWLEGRLPSARPLAPLGLILGVSASTVWAAMTGRRRPLLVIGGSWGAVALVVGLQGDRAPGQVLRTAGAVLVLHSGYGVGLLAGLLRGPWSVRAAVRQPATTP